MRRLAPLLREATAALRRSPGFTLAVVLLLAVGVGLNDAIFTVVDCVLLQPIGFHDADRIVALESHLADRAAPGNWIGGDDYTDLSRNVHGLQSSAFYSGYGATGVELGKYADTARVTAVSPAFVQVLGATPIAGRLFDPADTAGTGAVVSEGFADRHFGSPAAALGQVVRAGLMTRTVIGVLPRDFSFPDRTDLWMELGPQPENGSRSSGNQAAVGRRRTDTSAAQLEAELKVFSQRLAASFPEDHEKRIEAVPLKDELVGPVRPTLRLLMGAAAVVLLIVCLNVGHLQLARSTRRTRALTVRAALGASRSLLALTAVLESLLLAVAGGVAALALAVPSLKVLLRLAPPDMPRLTEIHPNVEVFAVSVLSALC